MRTSTCIALAVLLVLLTFGGSGCLLEQKVLDIVFTGRTCAEFEENHTSAGWTTSSTVDYADEIRGILIDNDIDIDRIKEAMLVSASYEVTDIFEPAYDCTLSGHITVQRGMGAAKTLVSYTSQSLQDALDNSTAAILDTAGVAVIDAALADFLMNPYASIVLTFAVENGSVVPPPTPEDPLHFIWEACVQLHMVYSEEFDVPDPF
jgi:hypothetical protein